MKSGMMTVNGTDVYTAAKFVIADVQGLEPWPARDTARLALFGRDGALVANDRRTVDVRRIRVTGSVEGTGSTLTNNMDALADLVERTDRVLQFPLRRAGVNYTGNLDGPRGHVIPPPTFRAQTGLIELNFVCEQPYGEDASLTVVTGAEDVQHECNIGTAPCDPYIKITGPTANPFTIIHRDKDDVEICRMTFNLALASSSQFVYVYGADGGYATKDVGAGEVSAMDDLAAGYDFPVLRPEHGNRALAQYQTLETDDGDIRIEFRRRWL